MPDKHPIGAYATALAALRAARVPHVVGGGLAVQHYGRLRATKDLDIFIRTQDVEPAMNALTAAGFTTMDTDATWLRKAVRGDAHIDLIVVSMGSIELGEDEIDRSLQVDLDGVPMRIFRAEDMLLRKIYLVRDGGPDWLDAFSILKAKDGELDWTILERDGLDPRPLVGFLLVADAHVPGCIPAQVLARHMRRARLYYDVDGQLRLPAGGPPAVDGAGTHLQGDDDVGPSGDGHRHIVDRDA